MKIDSKIAAIVLAGGEGTRIGQRLPKVLYPIAGKPMIHYTLDLLDEIQVHDQIVVVGFRADEVKASIGRRCDFAYQEEQLGTAHALWCGLNEMHPDVRTVLVLNGDDSAFYEPETLRGFIKNHLENNLVASFTSILKKDPRGLGRVVRDKKGKLLAIQEEKEATKEEKKIKEVNSGCYLFNYVWLKTNARKIKKSKVGEYYITDYIKIALDQNKQVEPFLVEDENQWFGINRQEELRKANQLMIKRYMQRKRPTVFFLGIDYLLIDSQRLKNHLIGEIQHLAQTLKSEIKNKIELEEIGKIFWQVYEGVREKNGFIDIPEIIHEFVKKIDLESAEDSFKTIFLTAPYADFVYPETQSFLNELRKFGKIVIVGQGDLVYQPTKLRGIGLEKYFEDYFIFEDLKKGIPQILKIYQGWRHIVIDDRALVLAEFLKNDPQTTTIWVRQGKYRDVRVKDGKLQPRFESKNLNKIKKIIQTL